MLMEKVRCRNVPKYLIGMKCRLSLVSFFFSFFFFFNLFFIKINQIFTLEEDINDKNQLSNKNKTKQNKTKNHYSIQSKRLFMWLYEDQGLHTP